MVKTVKTRSKLKSTTKRRKSTKNINIGKDGRIISVMMSFQNNLKLFHWSTSQYSQHKASDQLYSDLNEKMDSFVEKMLGKLPDGTATQRIIGNVKIKTSFPRNILKETNDFKQFLINMRFPDMNRNSDLLNLRDEILGLLNQFLYLMKLH